MNEYLNKDGLTHLIEKVKTDINTSCTFSKTFNELTPADYAAIAKQIKESGHTLVPLINTNYNEMGIAVVHNETLFSIFIGDSVYPVYSIYDTSSKKITYVQNLIDTSYSDWIYETLGDDLGFPDNFIWGDTEGEFTDEQQANMQDKLGLSNYGVAATNNYTDYINNDHKTTFLVSDSESIIIPTLISSNQSGYSAIYFDNDKIKCRQYNSNGSYKANTIAVLSVVLTDDASSNRTNLAEYTGLIPVEYNDYAGYVTKVNSAADWYAGVLKGGSQINILNGIVTVKDFCYNEPSGLTTTAKTVVGAINEINAKTGPTYLIHNSGDEYTGVLPDGITTDWCFNIETLSIGEWMGKSFLAQTLTCVDSNNNNAVKQYTRSSADGGTNWTTWIAK